MKEQTEYFVEVEKGLDWHDGYLDFNDEVILEIKDAQKFENKEDAQNAADLFNVTFGRNGQIYARVR